MTDIPEQYRGSGPASVPVKDRRLHARQRVSSLTYVDLGQNNGGIVLNVSEAGIGIQAAAALEEGPISLRLQLPGTRKRLEINAEVVWVGRSRKEAGLYFVDLSEDARSQIQKWIAREASPEALKEEEESEVDAEPAEVEPGVPEPAAVEAAAAVTPEPVADEPLATEDEVVIENELATERAATADRKEMLEETASDAPEELPEEIKPSAEPHTAEREAPPLRAPNVPKKEFERAVVETAPPVTAGIVEPPVSVFNGISGTHGAPSMGFASQARVAPRPSPIGGEAPLFVRPHNRSPIPDDDGTKGYRVKRQSGWFIVALVLFLALISFVAGMAVRRGALNSVTGQTDEPAHAQSAPPPTADAAPGEAPPASASLGERSEAATATKPLEIEVVDSSGRRWEIPAAPAANRPDASATHEPSSSETATPAPDEASTAHKPVVSRGSAQDASSVAGGGEKLGAPLMLTLPETPISASGSVAIRSRGVVPVPPGAAASAQEGRNLQIGQLTNLVEPVYPPEAQKKGIEGTVKLHAVIGVDGRIQSLEPRSGPEPLVQAAMTAVREWKYNPTTLNGKPIETQEDVSFAFRLPK